MIEFDAQVGHKPLRKTFSRPLHLIFRDVSLQANKCIEVTTLSGLKTVIERLAKKELEPLNNYSTLELQLFGYLAEYIGLLRPVLPGLTKFNEGIECLGPDYAELVSGFAGLFGDEASAIEAINSLIPPTPSSASSKQLDVDDYIDLVEASEPAAIEPDASLLHGVNVYTPTAPSDTPPGATSATAEESSNHYKPEAP